MLQTKRIEPGIKPVAESIDALIHGRTSLERVIRCIDAAERLIVVNMFIWRDDPAGNRVGKALLDAANRGVEIVVTKDRLGAIFELGEENRQSFFHKRYGFLTALKQRVINAYSSKPDLLSWIAQKPNRLADQLREHQNITIADGSVRNDHSKFTIIDDETLFVGGMNFEERIVSCDANGLQWQDYMIECVSKTIVANLKGRLSGEPPGNSSFEFILNDNARIRRFEIKARVLDLLNGARKTCLIEMAYFCDADVRDGVIRAAGRGVGVQIIIPAWANIQNERNLKTMQQIFERTAGKVAIYLSPDMLHSKMMDIDGRSILVGSANLNERALEKFSEVNILLSGNSHCAEKIRRTFIERRNASTRVIKKEELNYRRVKELCEYIFG